jgi:hypothetical protein
MHDKQIVAMRIVGVVILLAGAALLLGAGLGEPTDRSRSLSRSYKSEVHDTFDYSFRLQTWLFGRPPFAPPAFGPSDHPDAWRITSNEPDPGLDVALADGELRIYGTSTARRPMGSSYQTGINGQFAFLLTGDFEGVFVATMYKPAGSFRIDAHAMETYAHVSEACARGNCHSYWCCECKMPRCEGLGSDIPFSQQALPKTFVCRVSYQASSKLVVVSANSRVVGRERVPQLETLGPFMVRFFVSSDLESLGETDWRLEEVHVGWDGAAAS